MDKQWCDMTREERRTQRMKKYLSGSGIQFRSPEAVKIYHERAARLTAAMMCRQPDRVPVNLPSGFFPAYYAGYNLKRVMNDYQAMEDAWLKFMNDFYYNMDNFMGPMFIFSAPALEILQYGPYKWPGHGLGDDVNTYQFVEQAYMNADEYDYLIKDPSDFSFRVIIPRAVGCLEPLSKFPALNSLMGMPLIMAYPFTNPEMRRAFQCLIKAGGFSVSFPLHKGDDVFMSNKQFEKFYWPSFKKVINALIDEGIMVMLFAEGRYNRRLEYIGDFQKGWVQWQFDQTDMANAKKMVGKTCCISGNVPSSVMLTGSPKDVKESCRRLIETCAPGGGYILSGGASATEASPANLRAFMEAALEYGVYK